MPFIRDAHREHLRDLASQLLTREGLSKSWLDIVLGSADRISHYVNPDVRVENDHMDIRKYVKFKKVMNFIFYVIHFLHANYSLHLILFLAVEEREKGGLK